MTKKTETQQARPVRGQDRSNAKQARDAHTNESPTGTVVYNPAPDAATPTAPAGQYWELKIPR